MADKNTYDAATQTVTRDGKQFSFAALPDNMKAMLGMLKLSDKLGQAKNPDEAYASMLAGEVRKPRAGVKAKSDAELWKLAVANVYAVANIRAAGQRIAGKAWKDYPTFPAERDKALAQVRAWPRGKIGEAKKLPDVVAEYATLKGHGSLSALFDIAAE